MGIEPTGPPSPTVPPDLKSGEGTSPHALPRERIFLTNSAVKRSYLQVLILVKIGAIPFKKRTEVFNESP